MVVYLTVPEVVEIHDRLVAADGGATGVRDHGALESALFRPQTGYYDDLVAEAAALLESLTMNHPFVDGNKRTAVAVTDTFLRANRLKLAVEPREAFEFLIGLFDRGEFRFEHLEPWLREHVAELR